MKDRGIIIPPFTRFEISPTGQLIMAEIDLNFIYKCVLYWDFLKMPDGADIKFGEKENPRAMPIEKIPPLKLLYDEGILSKVEGMVIKFDAIPGSTFFESFSIFEKPLEFISIGQIIQLNKWIDDNIQWSIGGTLPFTLPSDINKFKYDFLELVTLIENPNKYNPTKWDAFENIVEWGPAVDIKLNNILPTPEGEIPIEKLLEFKRKRRDELQRLRIALDKLYLETIEKVQNSKDPTRELEHCVNLFEQELKDFRKVVSEGFLHKIIRKTEIKLDPLKYGVGIANGLIVGGMIGQSFNIPLLGSVVGAVGGAALASISIDYNSKEPKPVTGTNSIQDYSYIFEEEKQFGRKRHPPRALRQRK